MNEMPKQPVDFIMATVIGGIVFLLPLVVLVALVAEVAKVMQSVAAVLLPHLPTDTHLGTVALSLIALFAILLVCFLAGLAAQRTGARRLGGKLDELLVKYIPGYAFVKAFAESMRTSDEISQDFIPVLVRFDDYSQLAFEISRNDECAIIYLPGAPNPWGGSVLYVTLDRVSRQQTLLRESFAHLGRLGNGPPAVAQALLQAAAQGKVG